MARKIVAGNWKMNLNLEEASLLVKEVNVGSFPSDVDLMMFPSHLLVSTVANDVNENIRVGVQNFNENEKGAFTGETSISQAKSAGASILLIGHSERRSMFTESDELLKSKTRAAVDSNSDFIFCCGEPLEVRVANDQNDYVANQLKKGLFHLSADEISNQVIAYEPVWAIGTGKTATVEQADEMHNTIREMLVEQYGAEVANTVSILYGGSCNASNAASLFACKNVDGGLIGGASLQAESFLSIANSFE